MPSDVFVGLRASRAWSRKAEAMTWNRMRERVGGVACGELPAETDPELLMDTAVGAIITRVFVTGGPIDERFMQEMVELPPCQPPRRWRRRRAVAAAARALARNIATQARPVDLERTASRHEIGVTAQLLAIVRSTWPRRCSTEG